jgi:CRP/FNR family transcriptional regulator, cyclic AMP receptor protein
MNREPEEKNLTSEMWRCRATVMENPEERGIENHKSGVMSEDGQFAPLVNMMELARHNQCLALSAVLRGKLCDELTGGKAARRIVPGECIYLIGDRAHSIYFLRTGLVKTSVVSEGGKELILGLHKPGEIFGELCFCEGERREQAMAIEESEVVEIRFDNLVTHLQQNRQAMFNFFDIVARHLSEAYDQLLMLSFDKTMERLARTILKLTDELGNRTSEGVEIGHYIKQEELAQMIATRREVVSSLLNRLREMGLISYSRKGPLNVNTKALQTYLDSLALKKN